MLGVSRITVHYWVTRRSRPNQKMAKRISRKTQGKIKVELWGFKKLPGGKLFAVTQYRREKKPLKNRKRIVIEDILCVNSEQFIQSLESQPPGLLIEGTEKKASPRTTKRKKRLSTSLKNNTEIAPSLPGPCE